MTTIVLNHFVFEDEANGFAYSINMEQVPAEKRSELAHGLIAQGIKIIAQRAASGKDAATRKKETQRVVKEIQAGLYEFGGGGGGPRLDAESEALRRWLESKMPKGKLANKDFPAALASEIRQYLITVMYSAGKTEEEIKGKLTAAFEANKEEVIRRFLAEPDVMALYNAVVVERAGAAAIKPMAEGLTL